MKDYSLDKEIKLLQSGGQELLTKSYVLPQKILKKKQKVDKLILKAVHHKFLQPNNMKKNKSQKLIFNRKMSPEVSKFDALNHDKASAHRRVMSSLYSQEIGYKELEKSVKRKKWLNASMMEHRDRQRQYANCKSKLKIQIMKDIVSE